MVNLEFIPDYMDKDVIHSYIPKTAEILREMEGNGNYCVAYADGKSFGFVRFFTQGDDKSIWASVDFIADSLTDLQVKLMDYLFAEFSF